MSFSTYLVDAVLAHVHGKTAYTMPTVYVGLSTTTPAIAGTGVTEPSTGAYARVTTSGSTWGTASAGSITNAAVITFPTATASWGTITYVVVYDAATAGNLLWFASVTSQAVASGVAPSIAVGSATSSIA